MHCLDYFYIMILLLIGNPSGEDRLGLDILCKIFAKKGSQDSLVYIYEDCEVCIEVTQ